MDWLGCLRRFFNIVLSVILSVTLVSPKGFAYAADNDELLCSNGLSDVASCELAWGSSSISSMADDSPSYSFDTQADEGEEISTQAVPIFAILSFILNIGIGWWNSSRSAAMDYFNAMAPIYGATGGDSDGDGIPDLNSTYSTYNGLMGFLDWRLTRLIDINGNFDRNLAEFYNHMLSTEDSYSGYMPKISSYLYNIASNIRISVDNQVVINENIVSILNIVSTMNGNLSTVKSNQVKIQSNIADICSFLTGEKFDFLLTDVEYIADAMEGSVVVKINSISGNVFGIKSSVDGLYSFFTGEKFGFLLDDVEYIADAMEGSVVVKIASIDTNLVNLYALLSDADFTGNGAWTSSNVNVTIRNLEEIADYVGNDQSVMFLKYINDQLNDISGQLDEIAALIVIKTIVDNLSSVLDSLQDAAQGFTDAVTKVFPFCIVFLIIGVLQFAASDPVTPDFDFTLPLPTGDASFTLSLSFLDNVIPLIRAGELLIFVILLFANYRKYVIAGDE